jgi:hypothetical protein
MEIPQASVTLSLANDSMSRDIPWLIMSPAWGFVGRSLKEDHMSPTLR